MSEVEDYKTKLENDFQEAIGEIDREIDDLKARRSRLRSNNLRIKNYLKNLDFALLSINLRPHDIEIDLWEAILKVKAEAASNRFTFTANLGWKSDGMPVNLKRLTAKAAKLEKKIIAKMGLNCEIEIYPPSLERKKDSRKGLVLFELKIPPKNGL